MYSLCVCRERRNKGQLPLGRNKNSTECTPQSLRLCSRARRAGGGGRAGATACHTMGLGPFRERPPRDADAPAPADCLECRLIGTGAMLGISGYFVYLARVGSSTAGSSHQRFSAAMAMCFAGAAVARWLA